MKSKTSKSKKTTKTVDYSLETLDNGIRVLTVEDKSIESVFVELLFGAGSRYETKEINGISHFLEHMFFKGTKKRPTAREISSILDGIGADFNAYTGKDHTGYYIRSSAKHLELNVELLSDMLLHSKLDKEEIEREKGVIIEEMRMYRDDPSRQVYDLYEELLYGDRPLGWSIGGPEKTINSLTRDKFLKYLESLYKPNNMIFVVAGNVTPTAAKKLAQKYFGRMKKGDFSTPDVFVDDQPAPRLLLQYKKTDQAHIILGFKSFGAKDPDVLAAMVLSRILGGGMSSRLFEEIRERRGLAYRVNADHFEYIDTGTFVVKLGSKVEKVEEAIKVILSEISRMKTEPVSHSELQRALDSIEGHTALEMESKKSIASGYGTQLLLENKIDTVKEELKKIRKVTSADILRVANRIFVEEKLNLAIIGPYKEKSRFEKLLKVKRYTKSLGS